MPAKAFLSRVPSELWTLLALLAAWQAAVSIFSVPEILVPGVDVVLNEILTHPHFYLVQSLHTLSNTLIAFVLSAIFGVGLAVAIVYSTLLEKTLYAALVAFNNVPKVALAPLLVIWLGTGNPSKIAMAVMISIFAIVIDAVLGLRSLNPDMIDLGRSMRGSGLKMLLKLRLPNALPSILAGMKVAVSLALVGAIVGEFVAAQNGLGFVILSAQGTFAPTGRSPRSCCWRSSALRCSISWNMPSAGSFPGTSRTAIARAAPPHLHQMEEAMLLRRNIWH
jgi:NitT/TauT family transport system permease protein